MKDIHAGSWNNHQCKKYERLFKKKVRQGPRHTHCVTEQVRSKGEVLLGLMLCAQYKVQQTVHSCTLYSLYFCGTFCCLTERRRGRVQLPATLLLRPMSFDPTLHVLSFLGPPSPPPAPPPAPHPSSSPFQETPPPLSSPPFTLAQSPQHLLFTHIPLPLPPPNTPATLAGHLYETYPLKSLATTR